MTIQVSTALRNAMLASASLKSTLDAGSNIMIYSGTPPANADAALSGNTLLCTISVSGSGIHFDTAVASAGVLAKAPAETWSGTNVATGTATFYRHQLTADAGALSTTAPRIQGTIAVAGADMNLTSVGLTSGATQGIDFYSVALPTA